VRSKIEIDRCILEQAKQFNCLGCELSLDGESDFDNKINGFQRNCGTIRKHLNKIGTDTQMQFFKAVTKPTLMYGSETCSSVIICEIIMYLYQIPPQNNFVLLSIILLLYHMSLYFG